MLKFLDLLWVEFLLYLGKGCTLLNLVPSLCAIGNVGPKEVEIEITM
jgi:hypothetical protein